MNLFLVLPYYFSWHYTSALSDIKNIWTSFLLFFYHFFSIPSLFATLFSPWMKIHDKYNIKESLLDTFIFNTLIRLFGVFVRLMFILIGVVLLLLTFVLGIVFYFIWLLMPVFVIGVLIWSINKLLI